MRFVNAATLITGAGVQFLVDGGWLIY